MPARQDRDAEAIRLARRFYTTRDTGGKRWSFRRLAEVEGTSKSRVADLIQHADDRGFVRIAVGTDAEQGSVSLEEEAVLEDGLRSALGVSVALLDLVLVPRLGAHGHEEGGGDALCEGIGSAAATRFIGPALAGSAVWTEALDRSPCADQPDRLGWGLVLAGGRTVKACAEWLAEVIRPEAPATRQVFGIGSCSGTMLREMQSIEPDKCGAILGPVFPGAVFRPTMGALAPDSQPDGRQPACADVIAEARGRADRRVMGLLGVGTLGSPDCRLHAAIRAHSVFSDDVTLAGVRPDLDALLKNCQEYQELTEHCLYYPVSDIANRLYALQVPLAASDPSTSPWNTPRARELFEEIERGVDCINERTLTYPIDELARGCSLAVLMAGGTEKVGGIYWALQRFPWQYVMLATDVETCRALVDVARRATPTSA